jgi:hypothetical protein
MVDGWVVFGVVICPFVAAFNTVVTELLLGFLALVHGLGLLRDNDKVGDTKDSGVVCLDGSAWLRPTHFNESLMEGGHFFGCGVERA